MCYSTTLDREVRALERHYNKRLLKDTRGAYLHPDELDDGDGSILFSKRTSAFARPYWPVICSDQPEVFVPCRWGFFKQGIADEEQAKAWIKDWPSFNAIAEDVETKATYKDAWNKGQRCLIPVSSFTEWQHVPIEGRKTPDKVPFNIKEKGADIFSLGGIWQDTALGYRVYTVLTTKANPLMEVIHNTKKRQPVIIPHDMEQFWLSKTLPLDHIKQLCDPLPERDMVAEQAEAA